VKRVAPPPITPEKCSADRYYELQFAKKSPPSECAGTPVEYKGAVIFA